MVRIKGADEPVLARRLLGDGAASIAPIGRAESNLVGRRWEMAAVGACWSVRSAAAVRVVAVVGPPGIGKSRLVREVAAIAGRRGVEVFTAFCESHTTPGPVPCGGAAAARGHRRRGSRRRQPPGPGCGTRFPTPTPRICCCSMTCWASPTRMLRCPRSIRMRGGGG